MSLISLEFILLLIFTFILYFIFPKKYKWIVLFISSFIFLFYDNFNIYTIIQVLIILFTSYIFGILIDKFKKKSKLFLILGIIIILIVLFYIKYTNLFINTINIIIDMLKIVNINITDNKIGLVTRISTIGLSYYSLIMISYLVDVYRELTKPEKNIFKLALFMSYFPILTSGPFIRYDEIKEDLYKPHKFNYERMCNGLVRILYGLFKLLIISERLSIFNDTVWNDLDKYTGSYRLLACLFFPIELYCNFSGSIDIIMGISEIFGINLPENFKSPFFSKSITELWRVWHITLGKWLKEYIFYPLLKSNLMQNLSKSYGKLFNKKVGKKVALYSSMLIMWILIGLWHNGSYNFILSSGIIQFIYIFLEDILEPISNKINKKLGIKKDVFSYKLYQIIRTYLLFSFSLIFFRSPNVGIGLMFIKGLFKGNFLNIIQNENIYKLGLDKYDFSVLIIGLIILFIVDYLKTKFDVRKKLSEQNIVFRWTILFLLIFFIIIFGCYGVGYNPQDFIYERF